MEVKYKVIFSPVKQQAEVVMILKQAIDIPNFNGIQKKLYSLYQDRFDGAGKETIALIPHDVIHQTVPELLKFFEEHNLIPDCYVAIIREPQITAPIHVDGDIGHTAILALNLPVANCDNTRMYWFDVPPEEFDYITDRGSRYRSLPLDYDWKSLTPTDELELTSPAMVRINVPHNITNDKDTCRMILSVRFFPEPLHIWPETIDRTHW